VARHKEFDPDVALGAAEALFRERGYEGVSTADLCERMQIARQSLYDTFGDKRSLFLAALTKYRDASLDAMADALSQPGTAFDGIERFLRSVSEASKRERTCGCMLLNAVGELAPGDREVARFAKANQQVVLRALTEQVRKGLADRSLRAGLDPETTAAWIQGTYYGTRAMAKIDPDTPHLDALVEPVLTAIRR
jgi:TetR/AcrR family transcriptional regulator, transcriptional repressor for nem operon